MLPTLFAHSTTLGLIKPHLVADGVAGLALDSILDRADVTAVQMFKLDKAQAGEFYEVYRCAVQLCLGSTCRVRSPSTYL